MSDASNPFGDLMKMGQAMFNQDWAKQLGQGTEAFSPEALAKMMPTMPKEAMEAFMGKGASPDGLDAKTRLLLTLQGLIVQGAEAEAPIRLTVTHLRESGASDQEITETIALAGLFGGAPAMTKAMTIFASVRDGQEDEA